MNEQNNINPELIKAINDYNEKFKNSTNAVIFEISKFKSDLEKILKDFPVNQVKALKDALAQGVDGLKDTVDDVKNTVNAVAKANDERIKQDQEFTNKINDITGEIGAIDGELDAIKKGLKESNEVDEKFLEEKKKLKEQELEDLNKQQTAFREGRQHQYNPNIELKENRRANEKKQDEEDEKLANELQAKKEKRVDYLINILDKMMSEFTGLFSNAVNSVTSAYEQHAGNMAAALNQSVEDISHLQHKIADTLQDESLNKAISNIQVMTEAANLVSAGYTNEEKLQVSAESIAIGKEIAPNLNFDSSTVKNLTNVFGTDFITKFSAIQSAVQETAGSTVGLNENLTKMMSDMEPLYTNAELSAQALQDTTYIEATLASYQEQGLITSSIGQEQLNMIAELMDPNKALKSSNTVVRSAAAQYGEDIWASGSVLDAFNAIQSATQQAYSSVGMGSSAYDRVSRSLVAGVFGNTATNSATWMGQDYLQGLDVLKTEDLDTVYNEQVNKLESGDYTTVKEQETNWASNTEVVQQIASFAKTFPMTYNTFSGVIIAQLNRMPSRIANALKTGGTLNSLFSGIGSDIKSGGIKGIFSEGSTLRTAVSNAGKTSIFGPGAFAVGSIPAKLTSGVTLGALAAGVLGTASTINQWDSDRSVVENLGHGGNTLSAILSNAGSGAGLGATIGSFVGNPLIGAGIGAGVGALTGLITAITANKEAQEKNTEALEKQNKFTEDMLGKNVSDLNSLEQEKILANGGGIAHTSTGDYEISYTKSKYTGFKTGLSYVPYDDMIVRLHKGEAIMTSEAAESYRKKNPNFYNTPMNEDYNIVGALKEQTNSIVDAVRGNKENSPLTKAGPKMYRISNQFA